MQTLGISESTPRSESWLKSLFWPSITSGADVDYLGAQGYWVCAIVAVMSFVFLLVGESPLLALVFVLFYFLGGVGVRERSVYAAAMIFGVYFLDMIVGGIGVLRILFCALLLSNLRATVIARRWKPDSSEAELPPRMGAALADKFADRLPQWLWPKIRVVYYAYSAVVAVFIGAGLLVVFLRRF